MKIFADVADKRYFAKLAKRLRLVPFNGLISDNGIYGVSNITAKLAASYIDKYLTSEGPVMYNLEAIDVKKVCGFYCSRAEYIDTDNDSFISVSVCDSEAGTLVCVAEMEG